MYMYNIYCIHGSFLWYCQHIRRKLQFKSEHVHIIFFNNKKKTIIPVGTIRQSKLKTGFWRSKQLITTTIRFGQLRPTSWPLGEVSWSDNKRIARLRLRSAMFGSHFCRGAPLAERWSLFWRLQLCRPDNLSLPQWKFPVTDQWRGCLRRCVSSCSFTSVITISFTIICSSGQ